MDSLPHWLFALWQVVREPRERHAWKGRPEEAGAGASPDPTDGGGHRGGFAGWRSSNAGLSDGRWSDGPGRHERARPRGRGEDGGARPSAAAMVVPGEGGGGVSPLARDRRHAGPERQGAAARCQAARQGAVDQHADAEQGSAARQLGMEASVTVTSVTESAMSEAVNVETLRGGLRIGSLKLWRSRCRGALATAIVADTRWKSQPRWPGQKIACPSPRH